MGQTYDKNHQPLAERMRPQELADFFGQEDLVAQGEWLEQIINNDNLVSSLIFWGPPGTGKTTLAKIIAKQSKARFVELSAVSSGVKDLREIISNAESYLRLGERTLLFIDEIHRWNKSQQDALLPYVEKGTIVLIGATTENPSFELNSALLSRSRVLILKSLAEKDLLKILKRALKDKDQGLGRRKIKISDKLLKLIAQLANGDARVALNILELSALKERNVSKEVIEKIFQKSTLIYDKKGAEHYNLISALHKSIRGNDADAALYWLARILAGGEDPLYIARRLVRIASEDIAMANNTALLIANEVFTACQRLGMPECGVHLAHCVVYLAKSKKDITVYQGFNKAWADAEKYGNLDVPLHLRNAPTKFMKNLGYGKDYKYTPLEDSSDQEYFPDKLKGQKYL